MKVRRVIAGIILLCVFCTASFYMGVNYNNSQRLNEERKKYLNSTYFEVDHMIRLLSSVESWGNSINRTDDANPYRKLLMGINALKIEADQTLYSMIRDKNSSFLRNLSDSYYLISGFIGDGVYYGNEQISNDFLKDGALTSNEVSFLTSLRKDLEDIKVKMSSNKTNQENSDLSMKDMNDIFKPFIYKYSIENLPHLKIEN